MLRQVGRHWAVVSRWNHGLRQPLPGFEKLVFSTEKPEPFYTETNVNDLGMTLVARPSLHGKFCTVGILVGTGSRQGHRHPSGISHLVEKIAFGPTKSSFGSRQDLQQFLDLKGGHCDALTDRESTLYALSIPRDELDAGIGLLLESAFQPVITPETVLEGINRVRNDLMYMKYELEREKEVVELACQASYRNNTLGLSRLMSDEDTEMMTPKKLEEWTTQLSAYRRSFFNPKQTCVVGIGVTTAELETAVEKSRQVLLNSDFVAPENTKKEIVSQDSDGPKVYFSISWEGPSYADLGRNNNKYAAHVLRSLLGGGSAFSTGGPGKGIKSMIYADVMCGPLGNSFTDFKSLYKEFSDSGIFTIYGRNNENSRLESKENIKIGIQLALDQMNKIKNGNFTDEQLERAKTQLISEHLRNMEVRPTMFEEFARETQMYGKPLNPDMTCQEISKVTRGDLVRLADKLLQSKPGVSLMGILPDDFDKQQLYNDVCMAQFNNKNLTSMATRFASGLFKMMPRGQ